MRSIKPLLLATAIALGASVWAQGGSFGKGNGGRGSSRDGESREQPRTAPPPRSESRPQAQPRKDDDNRQTPPPVARPQAQPRKDDNRQPPVARPQPVTGGQRPAPRPTNQDLPRDRPRPTNKGNPYGFPRPTNQTAPLPQPTARPRQDRETLPALRPRPTERVNPYARPLPTPNYDPYQRGGLGKGNAGNSQNPTVSPPVRWTPGQNSSSRIDRTRPEPSDSAARRAQYVRTAQANYNSTHNINAGNNRPQPFRVGRIDVRNGSLQNQVLREDEIRSRRNRYRSGYYYYWGGWRDDNFYYPYYRFDYGNGCAFSPWYYYSNLPGYIVTNRIVFGQPGFDITFYDADPYRWSYRDRYDEYDRNYDLDVAIRDLVQAFERNDADAFNRLLPNEGRVYVNLDGGYGYTVGANDFHDLMLDGALSTRTDAYNILSVRRRGSEAKVIARHDFVDAWDQQNSVYHAIVLRRRDNRYEFKSFEVSQDDPR